MYMLELNGYKVFCAVAWFLMVSFGKVSELTYHLIPQSPTTTYQT